jgi:translation initiation factor 5B
MSRWVGTVTADGQPRNAVTVIVVFAAIILCTIIPSQVAFTSLVSAGAVPTIAAYGLIALLRLTMTPNKFRTSHFRLGAFAKPFYVAAVLFNGLVFAVRFLLHTRSSMIDVLDAQVMISPFVFPVTAQSFNFVSSTTLWSGW